MKQTKVKKCRERERDLSGGGVAAEAEDNGLLSGGGGGSESRREREGETTRETTVRDDVGTRALREREGR